MSSKKWKINPEWLKLSAENDVHFLTHYVPWWKRYPWSTIFKKRARYPKCERQDR